MSEENLNEENKEKKNDTPVKKEKEVKKSTPAQEYAAYIERKNKQGK